MRRRSPPASGPRSWRPSSRKPSTRWTRPSPAWPTPPAAHTPAPPVPEATALPAPAPLPVHASFEALAQTVNAIIAGSGADVGVSLIELGGPVPSAWSDGGSTQVDAASTYKL